MITLIVLYFFLLTRWMVFSFFFLGSRKVTIRWKHHWRIGGGLKCKHPFTWECCVDVICDLCTSFASKYLMHWLFHNTWDLLPLFVYSLVSIVMLYDGLTMIEEIGANHMGCAKMGWFALTRLISFLLLAESQLEITQFIIHVKVG